MWEAAGGNYCWASVRNDCHTIVVKLELPGKTLMFYESYDDFPSELLLAKLRLLAP